MTAGLGGVLRTLGAGGGLAGVAAIAGCVWFEAPAAPAPDPGPRMAEAAELRLTDAALRAERALSVLQRIRSGDDPALGASLPRIVAPELLRRVTLEWVGPLPSLLESLAGKAGYGFAVAGPRPAVPLVVSVSADDEALIFVLRDAGLQAGSGALVVVDAERREVRLDWRPGWEAG